MVTLADLASNIGQSVIMTYRPPSAKAILMPSFCQILICNFQTNGTGIASRTTSVKILGIVMLRNGISEAIHLPCLGRPLPFHQ